VDLTGVLEILGGILVLFKTTRKTGVYLLLGLLILFFIFHQMNIFTTLI
jgi:uncharacterized membrane protein